jgi:uncharacterized protein (DUF2336 family)
VTEPPAPEAVDVDALMNAARDGSPEGRARLFGLLGRLFLARGAELGDNDRRGFTDLLTLLQPTADLDTRLELAYATAQAGAAPSELARLLAEDEIEVAALVLFGAAALGTAELLALAEDEARARIIAGRRHLPMMVADALMRREDREIARALLKNAGSRFSITALDTAIELSRNDTDLQRRIAQRPELLEEMAKDMLDWVEPAVREQLIERFELAPLPGEQSEEIDTRLRNLLGLDLEDGPSAEHEPETTTYTEHAPAGPAPDPRFRLTPRLMSESLRRGDLIRAEAMFAQMAGLPAPLIHGFARDNDGESIAIAARGIGMSREEFATLYLLWRKARSANGLVSAGELGTALDRFDTVAADHVDSLMGDWRQTDQPDSLSA